MSASAPLSCAARASRPTPLDDERHERDHECPRGEDVGVDERDAEQRGGLVEQRENRIVEEQEPQYAERHQPLGLRLLPVHRATSRARPDAPPGGRRTVILPRVTAFASVAPGCWGSRAWRHLA